MKITGNFISKNQLLSFKGNKSKQDEWHVFGFDDEVSQAQRSYIRQHYELYKMPYYHIYESEKRLNDYQLKHLVHSFIKKPVYENLMDKIPLRNISQINSTSYRGSTPAKNVKSLPLLKNAGIKRIIDLAGFPNLQSACEASSLEYFNYAIDEEVEWYFKRNLFKTKEDIVAEVKEFAKNIPNSSKELINNSIKRELKSQRQDIVSFVNFIKTMQKGNVYIGCEHGITRTDMALSLNYLFNPKQVAESKGYIYNNYLNYYNIDILNKAKILYKNLTAADKLEMGWSKMFDEQFIPKLRKLVL